MKRLTVCLTLLFIGHSADCLTRQPPAIVPASTFYDDKNGMNFISSNASGGTFVAFRSKVGFYKNHTPVWLRDLAAKNDLGRLYDTVFYLLPLDKHLFTASTISIPGTGDRTLVVGLRADNGTTAWKAYMNGKPDVMYYQRQANLIIVRTVNSGAMQSARYGLFQPSTGHQIETPEEYRPAALLAAKMLLIDDSFHTDVGSVNYNPDAIQAQILDLKTEKYRPFTVVLRARSGCGNAYPPNGTTDSHELKFSRNLIVANRTDRCGPFKIIIDWTRANSIHYVKAGH